jgi:hypothetical protein
MPTVDETKMRVQRILASKFNGVQLTEDGFSIENGSTAAHIRVRPWIETDDRQSTWVHVWAPVAREVRPSPQLYQWAATRDEVFGSVQVIDRDGECMVVFDYSLLGDNLDPAELENAVAMVAIAADRIDDEVVQQFGGKRYIDQ